MKNAIEVFIDRCVGCHTCEMECALAHAESDTFVDAAYKGEKLYSRIILDVDGDDTIPTLCRHCTDAPCISACPTSAMSRKGNDEPVVLNADRCIGCKGCVMACPFGVIKTIPDTEILSKCDFCVDRLSEGKIPACAAGCPTGAIRYTSFEEVASDRRKDILEKYKVTWAVSTAAEK